MKVRAKRKRTLNKSILMLLILMFVYHGTFLYAYRVLVLSMLCCRKTRPKSAVLSFTSTFMLPSFLSAFHCFRTQYLLGLGGLRGSGGLEGYEGYFS